MAEVIHTGREGFGGEKFGFSAANAIGDIYDWKERFLLKSERIRQERENTFLGLLSVDTDNLVLEKYQAKAQEILEQYTNEASAIWAKSNGILSTEDKMALLKKKQEVESRLKTFRAKAEQYVSVRDTFVQRTSLFDFDETSESIQKFLEDPINNDVPTLVPAYKDYKVMAADFLNRVHPWEPQDYITTKDGRRLYTRIRNGIPDEDAAKEKLALFYNSNDEVRRSVIKDMKVSGASGSPVDYFVNQIMNLALPDEILRPAPSVAGRGYGGSKGRVPIVHINNDLSFVSPINVTLDNNNISVYGMSYDGDTKKVVVIEKALDPNTKLPLSFTNKEDADAAKMMLPGYEVDISGDGKYYLTKKNYIPIDSEYNKVNHILQALESYYTNNPDVRRNISSFRNMIAPVSTSSGQKTNLSVFKTVKKSK